MSRLTDAPTCARARWSSRWLLAVLIPALWSPRALAQSAAVITSAEAERSPFTGQPLAERKPPNAVPVAMFRFGYGAYGGGDLDFRGQCVGSCPLSTRNERRRVTERKQALLGFDFMFGPEPLSMGIGTWFTTGTTLETSGAQASSRGIGWEFTTPLLLGAAVPVTDSLAIRIGAFGGPEVLFADAHSAQGRDGAAYDRLCDNLGGQVSDCDVSFATRLAWTYGLHAGPIFRTSRVSTIGAELLLQRLDFELFDVVAEGSNWRAQQIYDYSAWRVWMVLNVGLGK
jgi:hypothetical protein